MISPTQNVQETEGIESFNLASGCLQEDEGKGTEETDTFDAADLVGEAL